MKCKNCGKDVFPGQFRCEHCGTLHPTEEDTSKKKPTTTKTKKTKEE